MLQTRYSPEEVMQEIDKISPDVVGLGTFSIFSNMLHSLATKIKVRDSKCRIIAGGPYCSAAAHRAASDSNIDCVVYGEGEETFLEILQNIIKDKPLKGILGTAHLSDGNVIINNPRPFIENIDLLPYPAFDLIDVPGYWGNISSLGKDGPWMGLFNSRGCPYQCIYCHNIFGKATRFMSPKRTLGEILFYKRQYGINEFQVLDDIFNLDVGRGIELCKMISKRKSDIRLLFQGGLRADIMQPELLHHMIKAGCCYISYAVESASPRIQKLIRKNLKLDKVAETINFTADAGIWVNTTNMLGFPTETAEEMKQTIDYNVGLRHHAMRMYKVIPQEGTGLYRMLLDVKKVKDIKTSFYVDFDELYSDGVSKEEFQEIIRYGWREFCLNEERLKRVLEMKSPTLSAEEIKRMYKMDITVALMQCGIKEIHELPQGIQPLVQNFLDGGMIYLV
jgi:radical SAM superfamily enzyme YgiQ (UPF0313 family)